MGTFAILYLFYCMVMTVVYNDFFFHFCMGNVIYKRPANTSSVAGVDKVILWTGVQGVFAVNKFRMQYNIALLTFGNQVWQPFPAF